MKTDKTLRVFSIIAAISFLLTAAVEFIPALNTSFIWIVLTLSFAVFCVALGIILAIGKSDKLHLRILSVASFLSGLSLAVRTAINYFISPPPIIGSLFDIMRVEIFYTAVYFVLFTYFGVLFI